MTATIFLTISFFWTVIAVIRMFVDSLRSAEMALALSVLFLLAGKLA